MKKPVVAAVVGVIVLLAAGLGFVSWSQHRPYPTATIAGAPTAVGLRAVPLELVVTAPSGKVRTVDARVVQGGKETALLAGALEPAAEIRRPIELDAKKLGLVEGPAEIQVLASDDRWRPKADVSPRLVQAFTVDLTPPTIEFRSATGYIKHAGSGVVAWRSRDASRTGVRCGSREFGAIDGLSQDPEVRVALFTIPYADEVPADPVIFAEDAAGNSRTLSVPVRFLDTKFTQDVVKLNEDFMRRKVGELDPSSTAQDGQDLLQAFLKINQEMRKANEATIRSIGESLGQARPLFAGAFKQQPNSKVFASFPQRRDYRVDGQTVDTEWHLGLDLASNKASPVLASNAGVVAFAGDNGIYGNMVVIDHGMGLASLYAHLSEMSVSVGQHVAQGESLGRTGLTGLAAGDHLHFAMLIDGTYTNPIDWFDGQYIADRIAGPLREAGISLPGITDVEAAPSKAERKAAKPRRR